MVQLAKYKMVKLISTVKEKEKKRKKEKRLTATKILERLTSFLLHRFGSPLRFS